MKKKKIVITGASSGIGKFLSNKLSKKNFVLGVSRRKIRSKDIIHYKMDIDHFESHKEFSYFCKKKFKKIDILINCAGITKEGSSLETIYSNFRTNFFAVYSLILNLKKIMNKNSVIINISSIASHQAFPNNPGYNCSKAALNMLTKSLSLDYQKNQIRLNTLTLGYFKTPMTLKSYLNVKKNKQRKQNTICNRWGNLEEILEAIEFIGAKNSNYLNGQEIILDGGWTVKGMK